MSKLILYVIAAMKHFQDHKRTNKLQEQVQ